MKTIYTTTLVLCLLTGSSCNKQNEWLDVKPNKSDVTPTTIENYQALLDVSEAQFNSSTPAIGLLGSDNFYVTDATYNAASTTAERNAYLWASDIWQGESGSDWNNMYNVIGVCNIVLDGIQTLAPIPSTQAAWNNVKGSALFFRAFAYYQLANLFAKQYDAATATTDAGLILRTNSDIAARPGRSSVEDTWQLIGDDLIHSLALLPDVAVYQTRPCRQSALGLLAKMYLIKCDYINAGSFADKALKVSEKLVDFNTLNVSASKPMPVFPTNPEVNFYAVASLYTLLSPSSNRCIADTLLYQSYATNDLRKTLFYTAPNSGGQVFFKGQYSAGAVPFSGIATNELLLILAECQARQTQYLDAMGTLNKLLTKRWKAGTFVPFTANSPQDALQKIVNERRKELPFTGSIPWEDLRRLNKDPLFAKTLTRKINGQVYTIPPNDQRYVLPIPDDEIKLSGIAQNPR